MIDPGAALSWVRAHPVSTSMMMSSVAMVACFLMLPFARRQSRMDARVEFVLDASKELGTNAGPKRWWAPVAALGASVMRSGLLSSKTLEDLAQTAAGAGARGDTAVQLFIGAKLLLMVGLPLAVVFLTMVLSIHVGQPVLLIVVPAVLGMVVPDMIVRNIRKKYLKQVEAGLAGALDLMIVCAEAGLTIEVAFERVALEFRDSNGPCAAELLTTAQEMKLLPERRQALVNLGERTRIDSLRNLGGTLSQSIQYGTPMTQALRVLAEELRHTTLMKYEARAARMPVLLTIPMILFILPCTFVVIIGPALLTILPMMRGHH